MHKVFPPPESFIKRARIKSTTHFSELYKASLEHPMTFWADQAKELAWTQEWSSIFQQDDSFNMSWFVDGRLNASVNCIDRHLAEKSEKVAIHWEGEPGDRRTISYLDLHKNVCQVANGFKRLGLGQGDIVTIYMPMVPELVFCVLACARLGITHNVVFAGFSSEALGSRVEELKSNTIVTCDGTFRKGRKLKLKANVDACVDKLDFVKHVVILERTGELNKRNNGKDMTWDEFTRGLDSNCPAQAFDSEHRLFVLYTSGSTGKPKGIVHSTAGYLLGAHLTCKYIFDLNDQDIFWCTADAAWITGHTYGIYGPLSLGATIVMYEGSPCTPDWNRFFKIIENYAVSHFYTAPTAVRSLIKNVPDGPDSYDLSSLILLGSVGEPISPETWTWFYERVGRKKCPLIDTWWQTETGAIMISAIPGASSTKPGCAGTPFFGISPGIITDEADDAVQNTKGKLMILKPWPSCARTIFGDHQRYIDQYWSSKQGHYSCGDSALVDEDADYWIKGRTDDVINVSGHRLSTSELEAALLSNLQVVEAAVIGVPDSIKGEGLCCFVSLNKQLEDLEQMTRDLKEHISEKIGRFACPERILFGETLPKTRSGKIMRRLLRTYARNGSISGDLSTLEASPSQFTEFLSK